MLALAPGLPVVGGMLFPELPLVCAGTLALPLGLSVVGGMLFPKLPLV
jgi:hypothetical protein